VCLAVFKTLNSRDGRSGENGGEKG